jgi:two-component system, LytTR family, response regulator
VARRLDYLRKPFTDDRFYDVLRRACRRVLQTRLGQAATTREPASALLAESHGVAASHPEELVVPEKGSRVFHVIRLHEIDWIEARDRGVRIHVGKEAFWLRRTLADVERRLDPDMFLRIHRSRIVNRTRITAVKCLWKGEYSLILANGKSLGTGRSYQPVVEAFLEDPGFPGGTSRRRAVIAARRSPIPWPTSSARWQLNGDQRP